MSAQTTDDIRIAEIRQLIAPAVLMEQLPLPDEASDFVTSSREQCADILSGKDKRLAVVVGPCSIHDTKAAIEYAEKLKVLAEEVKDDLFLIMRVYFEKPRTTVGWKGLINDPDINETYQINKGLTIARELLIDLANMGICAGTEFLDTISPQYYADIVSWGAIGARTTESQLHRELASGLSMPVGFKNGTGGNFQIAIDAIQSGQQPHCFLSIKKSGSTAIVQTTGNEDCHIILRGGKGVTNFDSDSVAEVRQALEANNLEPSIMIDCSHANSHKKFENQPGVCETIAGQIAAGDTSIRAVMIESHLKEGNQKTGANLDDLTYGQSITDACVSWETTEEMIAGLAKAVRMRRATFIA
ncbi:MAG: 3-deoxy-7-phosphoheptulonate synthase [Verrucomicrobiota bacterium]